MKDEELAIEILRFMASGKSSGYKSLYGQLVHTTGSLQVYGFQRSYSWDINAALQYLDSQGFAECRKGTDEFWNITQKGLEKVDVVATTLLWVLV